VHEDQLGKNPRTEVPALGPEDARPEAFDLRWQNEKKWKSISELKGKVIYINFWASWCEPCKTEMPIIESLQKKYGKKNYQTLLINLDSTPEAVSLAKKMLREMTPSADGIFSGDKEMRELYNIQALPLHMVIDKKGRTAAAFYARIDKQKNKFEALIEELIRE
jgi:thiol-disulfide isomerase/thioredoxin